MSTEAQQDDTRSKSKRTLIGIVTSDKMTKTVVVMVSRRVMSHSYKKFLTKRTKYKAHNENNDVKTGDTVEIIESRPMSKDKRWRVVKLLEKAKQA